MKIKESTTIRENDTLTFIPENEEETTLLKRLGYDGLRAETRYNEHLDITYLIVQKQQRDVEI